MFKKFLLVTNFLLLTCFLYAQNTLPDFSIEKNKKNENIISWRNPFSSSLIQLVIQRSMDSVKNFKSVHASENPALASGTYSEVAGSKYYYKIFYMLQDGSYYSTAVKTVPSGFETPGLMSYLNSFDTILVASGGNRDVYQKQRFMRLRDSVIAHTADSLVYVDKNMVNYVHYVPQYIDPSGTQSGYKYISNYVYLNSEGNPVIKLPYNDYYKYSMTIFNRDGREVMYKIESFNSSEFILSKSSFIYPGFYPYEIKFNNQVRDKNRIEIR